MPNRPQRAFLRDDFGVVYNVNNNNNNKNNSKPTKTTDKNKAQKEDR